MPERSGREFQGRAYRLHHKSVDPLSDSAAKKAGGRFNRAGRYGALYASIDRKTAEAEVGFRLGLPVDSLKDFRVTTIEVELKSVLDLTDPLVLKELGIEPAQIRSDSATKKERLLKIADEERSRDYEAILSPSARDPRGKNLNIFMDKLKKGSRVRVIKTELL